MRCAKAFVADLEQALAGGQIIAKSVAPLQSDFTVPAPGATADLWVESFAGFPATQVFQNGDVVMVRTFSRTGTSLTIGNAFGTVSGAFIVTGEGRQRWTFTRLSGTVNGHPRGGYMAAGTVVPRGTLALDFGVSGNGYYEVNAIDGAMGANSPYAQIVTWNAHPWYDRTVRSRYGNLYGVFASAGEYGMFAGDGAANADKFLRLSNNAIEGHNLPIRLYDGATQVVRLEPGTYPYLGIGSPAPTSYLGATGIWMGKHSTAYKAHVGTVSGGDVTAGWKWDGTTLTVRGQIYVTGGDAAKTDLSNVGANVVSGKVNADSTLIQPGRILISGSTTLDDWRHPSDTTLIDGGDIYAGTITAEKGTFTTFNLVDNPGFEYITSASSAPGWVLIDPNATFATGVPRSGTGHLRVQRAAAGEAHIARTDYIAVRAGETYYVEGYVRVPGATPYTVGLRLGQVDASLSFLRHTTFTTSSMGSYVRVGGLVTLGSDCARVTITAYVGTDFASGAVAYWDDVVLREATGMNVLVGVPGGARVEINSAGVEGYSDASTRQFYLDAATGRGMFGGGEGVLDKSGLVLSGDETSYVSYNAVRWMTQTNPSPGGNEVARLSAGLQYRRREQLPPDKWNANENRSYAQSNLLALAYSGTSGNHAIMSLVGSSTSPWASLSAMIGNQAAAGVIVSGSPREVSFVTNLTTRATIRDTGLDVAGVITSSGRVNGLHPHFILPVGMLPSKTLTSSYQNVVYRIQGWNDIFQTITGQSFSNMTGWSLYWVVPVRFQTNPTNVRGSLYHYSGGWGYHPYTYVKSAYGIGLNYMAFGPWPLTGTYQIDSMTNELHLLVESGASAKSAGPEEGGTAYILFRRD